MVREGVHPGRFYLFTGPMYSKKTAEVLGSLRDGELAGQKVAAFKPASDTRNPGVVFSRHMGRSFAAHEVHSPREMLRIAAEFRGSVRRIGIDELQFFDRRFLGSEFDYPITDAVRILLEWGFDVYGAALDRDFRGEAIEDVCLLSGFSFKHRKLFAICAKCHAEDAEYSQRVFKDTRLPVPWTDPLRFVQESGNGNGDGHAEAMNRDYEPRCRFCHEIERPESHFMPWAAEKNTARAPA